MPVSDSGTVVQIPDRQVVVETPPKARRRTFTVAYKLDVVDEYDRSDALGRGALLRREGLYTSTISEWRRARDGGSLDRGDPPKRGPRPAVSARRLRTAEEENARLRAELDTARRVIKIQGELAALLERLSATSATPTPESEAAA
jgi:transposase-like protein